MLYDNLLQVAPFSLPDQEKIARLKSAVAEAFDHHFNSCQPYRKLCEKRGFVPPIGDFDLADLPYLPVNLFKQMRLSSVPEEEIVRTLNSSATTSQTPSTVVIDNVTRMRQIKTLMWLLGHSLGKQRRPFIILDVDPATAAGNATISARSAAIRGFLPAASSARYCMIGKRDGSLSVDLEALDLALREVQALNKPAVIFGFTYVLYSYVAEELQRRKVKYELTDVTVMHIGGWKKLQDRAVDKETFNQTVAGVFGLAPEQVIDIYGFTEQLGLVYIDHPDGYKRTPLVSEIIIRDPLTLQPVPDGTEGLIELITPMPHSYPGIAVLLDDIGRIVSREPATDGCRGTAFEVIGRARQAEVRGCGDIMSEKIASQ